MITISCPPKGRFVLKVISLFFPILIQKRTVLEVIVRNPTPKEITLSATITGRDLSGPSSISLPPGEKDVYTLTFAPAQVGKTKGRCVIEFFIIEIYIIIYTL